MGCAALALSTSLGCGQQPCDGGEAEQVGPTARLDVALETCNHRPVASAVVTSPADVVKKMQIELDGSQSLDADGAAVTFAWTVLTPSKDVQLLNPSSPKAIFTSQVAGDYELQLVVSDGELDSLPLVVRLGVTNTIPVADAGLDEGVAVTALATLDGRASSDANGDELTYTWYFESRAPGSSAMLDDATHPQPSFTVDAPGIYVIALRVFDGESSSEVDTVRIGGGVVGSGPTANAGSDGGGTLGLAAVLDGSASQDPDGDPLSYHWKWVTKPVGSRVPEPGSGTNPQIGFVPDFEGVYVAELYVDDGFYSSETDSVSITIVPGTGVSGEACVPNGCQSGSACFEGVCVGVGRLRFSLSWTAISDFDLYVLTPQGNEISYSNRTADGGELDVDDCIGGNCRVVQGVHVENVFFPTDFPSGRYQTWVENFNGGAAGSFTLEVSGAGNGSFTDMLTAAAGAQSQRFTVIVP